MNFENFEKALSLFLPYGFFIMAATYTQSFRDIAFTILIAFAAMSYKSIATPPAGFVTDQIGGSWNEVVGVTNFQDGRLLAWERGGRIWMMSSAGVKYPEPVLDIHDEVGAWRDFGLLGVAIDPAFPQRPYIYLVYVVDRHHLLYSGTPQYNANTDSYYAASIGRITRYTLDASTNYSKALTNSRTILVGESITTGLPICHQSHSIGTLIFGEDGTLLVSMGDSASYQQVDIGGQVVDGYIAQALADGIIKPKEDIGAFRAQLIDSLCGKILRIDPDTGNGIASNPFFDPTDPRAPRSRVWALGLRNPFRIALRPETGSHDPTEANPGLITVGDVGWNTWEELSVIDGPGKNLGWPIFEGINPHLSYSVANVQNPDVLNPHASGACTQTNLYFRDLLRQANATTAVQFIRPCAVAQAEDAIANNAPVGYAEAGFSGAGYRDIAATSSAYIEWTVIVPTTGLYQLAFRYANIGPSDLPQTILVDNTVVQSSLSFLSTDSWSEWNVSSTVNIQLTAGSRKIKMCPVNSNGPNIDCLWLSQDGSAPKLPSSVKTFTHCRPSIEWQHGSIARTPSFTINGASTTINVGSAGGATGATFGGSCGMSGPQIYFPSWPDSWQGAQFIADYGSTWIRVVRFGLPRSCGETLCACSTRITAVETFDNVNPNLVGVFADPVNEAIYAAQFGALYRYRWLPGGSQPPVARLTATPQWGPSPLSVQLSGTTSTDPESAPLTYLWQFGDGTPNATGANATHTFSAPSSAPAGFTVTLTVTDPGGATDATSVVIGPNNSPPQVDITSIQDGQFYSIEDATIFPLNATVTDAQHSAAEITCQWKTILHHNAHLHPEPFDFNCSSEAIVSPLGCGFETYFYEVSFTATDAGGLSASTQVRLYPDCDGTLLCPSDLNKDHSVAGVDMSMLLVNWNGTGTGDINFDGVVDGADLSILFATWGPCR